MDSGRCSSFEEEDLESLHTTSYEDLNRIGETFQYYLKEHLYTDIQFKVKCGDEWMNYNAHKLVLCIWSPVLADMISEAEEKAEEVIEITDVTPFAFEIMVKFMYGLNVLFNHRKEIEVLLKVYNAAVKYQVEFLKATCFKIFTITPADKYNVFKLLEAGKLIHDEVVQQRCLKVLQDKTATVLSAHDLSNVTPSMMKIVLELPSVSFSSEYELLTWVFAWIKNELLKTTNQRSYKEIMNKVLPYMKFTALKVDELGKLLQNIMKNQKSLEGNYDEIINESDGFKLFMNVVNPGSYPLPEWCTNEMNIKRTYKATTEEYRTFQKGSTRFIYPHYSKRLSVG